MNLAVITIGNRDVLIKSDHLPESLQYQIKIEKIKETGQYLFENYGRFKDKISYPIFQPYWNNLKDCDIKIDKIILIATDQNDERYSSTDTYYFAEVLKKQLERERDKDEANFKVEIFTLKDDINNLAKNYELFKQKLIQISYDSVEKMYLLPVGGMPNINTALIMAAIRIMKEKIIHYSVTQDKSTVTVPLNRKFLNEIESDKIVSALDKYFFASVMEISTNQLIKDYANIAYSMINFDFITAKKIIDNLILDNPNNDFSDYPE